MKPVSQKALLFFGLAVGLLAASAAGAASAQCYAPPGYASSCYEPPRYEPPCDAPPYYTRSRHTPASYASSCRPPVYHAGSMRRLPAYDSSFHAPRQVGRAVSAASSLETQGQIRRGAENIDPSMSPASAPPTPQPLPASESPLFEVEVAPADSPAIAPGEAESTVQPEARPFIPTLTQAPVRFR